MNFPAYVPAAVRDHIRFLIGDKLDSGWANSLASAEQKLRYVQDDLTRRVAAGEFNLSNMIPLRKEFAAGGYWQSQTPNEETEADRETIRRLGIDNRMQPAYSLLTAEFSSDDQWRDFTYSAWASRWDFALVRARLAKAKTYSQDIATLSKRLAGLLREATELHAPYRPDEFYDVRTLLKLASPHDTYSPYASDWEQNKHRVLGADDVDTASDGGITVADWSGHPSLFALLEVVATAAERFSPEAGGIANAATSSQKRNDKMEYLRAFGSLLSDCHGFILTPNLKNAMAIVANVVINDPEIDVTYDDVRNAVEDSRRK